MIRGVNNKGFSLIEVMMAVAILLVIVSGLLLTFVYCILLNQANSNLVIASNDAQYILEQVRA
jgi:prepilin-type N-terminal cleavage/methylation domain-containing protein